MVRLRINPLTCFTAAWLAFFSNTFVFAQQVRISASIDSTNYLIGDWIYVHVSVDHPDGVEVLWENPVAPDFGNFKLLSESKVDSILQNDFLTENKVITFTTFDTGVLRIPSFTFTYRRNNRLYDETTSPLPVHVSSVGVDLSKPFHPIKPRMTVAADTFRFWLYATTAVTFSVIMLFLFWYYRRQLKKKKSRKKIDVQNDNRLPHEKALDELMILEEEKPWQQDLKGYYTRITQVVREYIENGLQVPAMENTSREIIALLRKKNLDPSLLQQLFDELRMADLVKFARLEPQADLHMQILHTARELVEKTRPVTPLQKEVTQR